MATTKNKNLFYQLYSKDKTPVNSGFTCSSAINEGDTSFDISGTQGQITDSNGDILASIDLSQIHAAGITQYTVETKILQPHSAYLLQGNEYGETYKSMFFLVNKRIASLHNYESYCNLQFDIHYKQNNKKCHVHVNTYDIRESAGSFVILAQTQLTKLKVPVSISIRQFDDENSSASVFDFINFQSTEEGYNFMVRNVMLTPISRDQETKNGLAGLFTESPFIAPEITSEVILDILNNVLSANQLKTDCKIYRKLTQQFMWDLSDTTQLKQFYHDVQLLKKLFLPCFDEGTGALMDDEKLHELIDVDLAYPEHIALWEKYLKVYYTSENPPYFMHDIVKIYEEMYNYIIQVNNNNSPSACYEDIHRRINSVKYPNGAMRGVVLIPVWPNDSDYDMSVIWVNHVADTLDIDIPVTVEQLSEYYGVELPNKPAKLYEKATAQVMIKAIIPSEKNRYIEDFDNLPLNDITSNDGFTTSFDCFQVPGYDPNEYVNNDFMRIKRDNTLKSKDELWTNRPFGDKDAVDTHKGLTDIYVGLYKYMDHLSKNDMWLRVGEGYMLIGKEDCNQCHIKNLLQSMLVYNPNNIPVKVKYILFS